MKRYMKFAAQIAASVLAAVVAALAGDNMVSNAEWINIAILALGAISVLGAGNLPSGVWKYTKLYVSAATAGLVVLASFLTDGVTTTEWLQVGIAVLGALGVIAAPGPLVLPQPLGRHQAT
jgi:hypothetical protein